MSWRESAYSSAASEYTPTFAKKGEPETFFIGISMAFADGAAVREPSPNQLGYSSLRYYDVSLKNLSNNIEMFRGK